MSSFVWTKCWIRNKMRNAHSRSLLFLLFFTAMLIYSEHFIKFECFSTLVLCRNLQAPLRLPWLTPLLRNTFDKIFFLARSGWLNQSTSVARLTLENRRLSSAKQVVVTCYWWLISAAVAYDVSRASPHSELSQTSLQLQRWTNSDCWHARPCAPWAGWLFFVFVRLFIFCTFLLVFTFIMSMYVDILTDPIHSIVVPFHFLEF